MINIRWNRVDDDIVKKNLIFNYFRYNIVKRGRC